MLPKLGWECRKQKGWVNHALWNPGVALYKFTLTSSSWFRNEFTKWTMQFKWIEPWIRVSYVTTDIEVDDQKIGWEEKRDKEKYSEGLYPTFVRDQPIRPQGLQDIRDYDWLICKTSIFFINASTPGCLRNFQYVLWLSLLETTTNK